MTKPFPYLHDPEGFLEEAAGYPDAFLFVNRGGDVGGPFLGYLSEGANVLKYDVWYSEDDEAASVNDFHKEEGGSKFCSPLTDEEFDSLGFAPAKASEA